MKDSVYIVLQYENAAAPGIGCGIAQARMNGVHANWFEGARLQR